MESQPSGTDTISSMSDALSELLNTGRYHYDPSDVRYVCHTSTIPLATTIDEQFILRDEPNTFGKTHSIHYVDDDVRDLIPYRCCKKHCMFVSDRNPSKDSSETTRESCPCHSIQRLEFIGDEEVQFYLQPLCFIQVIKETRYAFGYSDASACYSEEDCCHKHSIHPYSSRPRINPSEVMFCQNSQSILDSSYSRPLRNVVKADGWEHLSTVTSVLTALDCLYWFRKKVNNHVRSFLREQLSTAFDKSKRRIVQTLHTLNGLLTKKFLCFPCEMESYSGIAKRTARLFDALIKDYFQDNSDGSRVPSPETSIFLRIKEDFKLVKELFNAPERAQRVAIFSEYLDQEKRPDPHAYFWATAFRKLWKRVQDEEEDYSTSIAWSVTMTGFSQTRNLGYLPDWVAEFRRKEYRKTITRPMVQVEKDKLLFMRRLIRERANQAGIPINFLNELESETFSIFRDCINAIKIDLKPSASIHSTVAEGGKLEDARQLLNLAIDNKWSVPRRDLFSGEETERIIFSNEMRESKPGYEGAIFWISVQLVINWMSEHVAEYKKLVVPLKGSEPWLDELFRMEVVHISEPGKERNLTKSSSPITWFLTPCSKVSQMALSYHQDHRAGLVLSAQDWMHQKRVSPESPESYFVYDPVTRLRKPDVWNSYQDWTESTDYIPRQTGSMALQAWLGYIGFPKWYLQLILRVSVENYIVKERIGTSESGTPILWEGILSEGFMMGNPLTKTILHLMHDVNFGAVQVLLKSWGVRFPSFEEIRNKIPLGPPTVSGDASIRIDPRVLSDYTH